ncbi:IS630 family transposase [Methylobacterium sp. 17Sr1-1]|uniref:IS630 family transposase n=1 Tax=Methylobacterium sp. 17Sr1-1 TaxID=2202826 RepID=UPI000D6EF536|nr:IS630 family transposase [Methylobacterium sp. 17Sr1-1]AWN50692.1 IS630 family transposase [Methylobacterium sp. 17Sr1-1]AWN50840.1 IS630 family transposase [Methylobacterium sp. 17Sr1-1]AWN54621.1 IS630 family transposase [Methylobacterium sp. 17Sr1-1]
MTSPLSVDLRERVVSAVIAGASCRQAGERFGVSAASVSRWHARHLRDGHVRPKPMGGDQRSHVIEAHASRILKLCEKRGNIVLSELRDALAEQGVTSSTSSLSRFLARHCITRKKGALHAAEQDRPDVAQARQAWFEGQLDLDPDRLVFIDETAASTRMARRYGWAPRGQRCRLPMPCGHYKTTTITAALRTSGLTATAIFEGATNGRRFLDYVTDTLVPALRPGDTVILDNLQAHKVAGVREAIAAAGARVVYLPPYSPEFNPIEQAFAKLKTLLRTAAARTVKALQDAIEQAFAAFTPQECRNYINAAGYQNDHYVSD